MTKQMTTVVIGSLRVKWGGGEGGTDLSKLFSFPFCKKVYSKGKNLLPLRKKNLRGRMVRASNFGSQGLGLESNWRQNSCHDCMALHCTEPFIVLLPSSW